MILGRTNSHLQLRFEDGYTRLNICLSKFYLKNRPKNDCTITEALLGKHTYTYLL